MRAKKLKALPYYHKFIGKNVGDPDVKERIEASEGDPKLSTAKYFYWLDRLMSLLKKEFSNNYKKDNKNE